MDFIGFAWFGIIITLLEFGLQIRTLKKAFDKSSSEGSETLISFLSVKKNTVDSGWIIQRYLGSVSFKVRFIYLRH